MKTLVADVSYMTMQMVFDAATFNSLEMLGSRKKAKIMGSQMKHCLVAHVNLKLSFAFLYWY